MATPQKAEDFVRIGTFGRVYPRNVMSIYSGPPECLRKGSPNPWTYNSSALLGSNENFSQASDIIHFLDSLTREEADECSSVEQQFKKFMYGGVSVQRLIPNSESRSAKTRKERHSLCWKHG